jgi:hypothetical protein
MTRIPITKELLLQKVFTIDAQKDDNNPSKHYMVNSKEWSKPIEYIN